MELVDYYKQDDVDDNFLRSAPACFIILGKPFSGKSTLAEKLAKEWRCPLISAESLLVNYMSTLDESEKSNFEPDNGLLLQLLDEMLKSPFLTNTGYVLDDLPQVSSGGQQFKKQLQFIASLDLKPNIFIYIDMPDADVLQRKTNVKVDSITGRQYVREEYNPWPRYQKIDETDDEPRVKNLQSETSLEFLKSAQSQSQDVLEFKLVDKKVTSNLVTTPECLEENVIKELQHFSQISLQIKNYMLQYDRHSIIELNGNLPPHSLFECLLETLKQYNVAKPILAFPLEEQAEDDKADKQEMDEMEDEDQLKQEESQDWNTIFETYTRIKTIAPMFPWQISRWSSRCPVALLEGNICNGKPENAVIFRDKIYFLSSKEAQKSFLENPRLYLLPPMPKHPVKFIVVGHPMTGTNEISQMLADCFNAKLVDYGRIYNDYVSEKMEKILEEVWLNAACEALEEIQVRETLHQALETLITRRSLLEEYARQNAIENVMFMNAKDEVKRKSKKNVDLDKEALVLIESPEFINKQNKDLNIAMNKLMAEWKDDLFNFAHRPSISSSTISVRNESSADIDVMYKLLLNYIPKIGHLSKNIQRLANQYVRALISVEINEKTDENFELEEEPVVDLEHPDVATYVIEAEQARAREGLQVSVEQKLLLLQSALLKIKEEQVTENSNVRDGGWIVNNFPVEQPLLTQLMEHRITRPAIIIVVQDASGDYNVIYQRWLDQQFERLKEDSGEKAIIEEETLNEYEMEEMSLIDELPESEITEDIEEEFKTPLRMFDQVITELPLSLPVGNVIDIINVDVSRPSTLALDLQTPVQDSKSVVASVMDHLVFTVIRISLGFDDHKRPDDIVEDIILKMNEIFHYKAEVVTTQMQNQEDEDLAATSELVELVETNGVELDDSKTKERLRLRGDAKNFCPVTLKEKWVMYSGDVNLSCRYRGRSYCFVSEENLNKFVKNPTVYIASKCPIACPPTRICLLGPRGSGITTQSRLIATHYDIFHINFRERLQELQFPKSCLRFGFPYQIDSEQFDIDDEIIRNLVPLELIRSSFEMTQDISSDSQVQQQMIKSKVSNKTESKINKIEPSIFTDEEQMIKNYLQNDEPLHSTFLEKLLTGWWLERPTRTFGFVLDGFPQSTFEAELLLEKGLMPDVVLFLSVGEMTVVNRFLPYCMRKWKERLDEKIRKQNEKKRLAAYLRNEAMAKRRAELELELIRKRKGSKLRKSTVKLVQDESEIESPEENLRTKVDAILVEEFPEILQEEEPEETEDEARARFENNIIAMFNKDEDQLSNIMGIFERYKIPCYTVNGNQREERVLLQCKRFLDSVHGERDSILERVHPITKNLADQLIDSGYKTFSRYGPWCPVLLAEGAVLPPYYTATNPPYPAIHRHHIYFLSSEDARNAFMRNPIKYLRLAVPKPIAPIIMSIVGPPKSGKTRLARRYEKELNMKRLSAGEAMRYVMNELYHTCLATELYELLHKGENVPDPLIFASIEVACQQVQCQLRGAVLDGFPNNMYHVQQMDAMGLIPFCMVHLYINEEESTLRWRENTKKQSVDYIHNSYSRAEALVLQMQHFYQEHHRNWIQLDALHSQWWLWETSFAHFQKAAMALQDYIMKSSAGKPASVNHLGLPPRSIQAQYGEFAHFCPVSLAKDDELVDSKRISSFNYVVDFKGRFYNCASQEYMDMFLANPELYLSPNAPKLPPSFHFQPTILTQKMMGMMNVDSLMQFGGFCPVTYLEGFQRYDSMVQGSKEFGVLYKQKVYLFVNEQAREKFLRNPEHYGNQKLPFKCPPPPDVSADLLSLPALGFLEQTTVTMLIKALTAVVKLKPKYPFRTTTDSALLYLQYYLKAYNTKLPIAIRDLYKNKLKQFEEECQALTSICEQILHKRCLSKSRAIEYNRKLDKLFAAGDRAKKRRTMSNLGGQRRFTSVASV